MKSSDQKLEKWLRWVNIIQSEVRSLVVAQDVFSSIQGFVRESARLKKSSLVLWYLQNTYAAYAVMCIRRHIKNSSDSISLMRLLSEIAGEPSKVSRVFFREKYAGVPIPSKVDATFDRFCKKKGDPHIHAAMVRKDLNELKRKTKSCEDFADRRIAHFDKRNLNKSPNLKSLCRAVDVLHRISLKYHQILNADDLSSFLPEWTEDWLRVFDYPWRIQKRGARLSGDSLRVVFCNGGGIR